MEIWLDAHISPLIAEWIKNEFSINCLALKDINYRDVADVLIFNAAKQKSGVIIMTKDEDFCQLLNKHKAPPKIIWLTFGNCANKEMKDILRENLLSALSFLEQNDLVEISR